MQAVQVAGSEVNRRVLAPALFQFFRNWGMKRWWHCIAVPQDSSTYQRRDSMAKGMTQKKNTKKKPATTVKEKRAAKVAKKK